MSGVYSFQWDTGGTTSTLGTLRYVNESPAGTIAKTEVTEFGVSLYFKFVKSKMKMNNAQAEWHKERLLQLKAMLESMQELGQEAASEEVQRLIAIAVRESEICAFGKNKYVLEEDVKKYINQVKDKCVRFETLNKFPRVIPEDAKQKILRVQDAELFDEYLILFVDHLGPLKTNREKIKEKDPIVFGRISYHPKVLYYICDWIDEHCDITLENLSKKVNVMKTMVSSDGAASGKIDPEYLEQIKKTVLERHNRLKNTKSTNWAEKVIEEEKAKLETKKVSHERFLGILELIGRLYDKVKSRFGGKNDKA